MNKVFAVFRREFVERVRAKAFLIGTFLFPLLMVFFMVMSALMMTGGTRTQRIAIVDGTSDGLGTQVESTLLAMTYTKDADTLPRFGVSRVPTAPARLAEVRDSLVAMSGYSLKERPDGLDGVLVLTDDVLIDGKVNYFGGNVGSFEAMGRLEGGINQAVRSARLQNAGVDPAILGNALRPAQFSATKVSEGHATGESGEAAFVLAYAMGFILYIALILYGQQTAMSVIDEKSSRIMEVLASSLKPFQMLLGKVLGVGAVGLLQLGIYAAVAFIATSQRGRIAGLFGVDPSAMQSVPLPSLPPDLLAVFLMYFVLGFLLYGALFAAVGSMVNSPQEMQQIILPVTLLMVVGFLGVFAAIREPNAGIAVILSFIPFFSPMVMPVRWSMAAVPIGHLLLSLALLLAGLLVVAWVAGRIYRTGILMYGKKPTLREVARWVAR
ncbi:MAG TPA: ABC transporter permease [Gemmatimonadales bacterium]|nr:ABC transporter permease [Gemmatimonadales bacterium]